MGQRLAHFSRAVSPLTRFLFLQAQNKIKLLCRKGQEEEEELGLCLLLNRAVMAGISQVTRQVVVHPEPSGVSTGAEHNCPGQLEGAPPSWELQVGRQTQTLTTVPRVHQLVHVNSRSLWHVIKRRQPFLPRVRGWTESLWRVKRAMFFKGPPVALCAWWWVLSSASGMKRFIIRTNCTSTYMATAYGTERHVQLDSACCVLAACRRSCGPGCWCLSFSPKAG